MSSKVYAVSPRFVVTPFNPLVVDQALTQFGDWIRYNGFLWFVYTPASSKDVSSAVMKSLRQGDNVVVFAAQPEAATGVADQWVWDWLNDRMQRQFRGE